MTTRLLVVGLAAWILPLVSVSAICQEVPSATELPSNPPAAAKTADMRPGLDDLMTMMVQPRHIKLYYAGTQRNWELAAFELGELRSALRRIEQAFPIYQNNDVHAALTIMIEPKLQGMAAAIAAANSRQFGKAFGELTQACNGCHVYLEHPFLVIKAPSRPQNGNYADQDFGSDRKP
jgi:hypothetical protein